MALMRCVISLGRSALRIEMLQITEVPAKYISVSSLHYDRRANADDVVQYTSHEIRLHSAGIRLGGRPVSVALDPEHKDHLYVHYED